MIDLKRLWIMKIKPTGGIDSFDFCRRRKVIGFGWGVENLSKNASFLDYVSAAKAKFKRGRGLTRLLNDFGNIVDNPSDHLIWVYDQRQKVYYLCVPTGEYHYNRDKKHETAKIVNTMKCEFHRIGFREIVPKAIVNGFAPKFTLREVDDEDALTTTKCLLAIIKKNETPHGES